MPLSRGTRLGPYEIIALIGVGGMGEVYRARDTRLDRIVAIKMLHQTAAVDPGLRLRVEQEARTVAAISHPYICALYDVGREGQIDYFVMEFLEGETLADRMARGLLPLELGSGAVRKSPPPSPRRIGMEQCIAI
jgi:eukaryotic-like serine/threonine-protein kinase